MNKILVILNKEWQEIRQQRTLLLTILLLPLLFTLIAVGVFTALGLLPGLGTSSNVNTLPLVILRGMSSNEITQTIVGIQMSLLFVL
ncbi:MAG TPA: hypothetical protein VIY29_03845, partial [Ktedonobacteraceae bacterium]